MKLAEIKKLVETYDLTALAAAEQHLMEGEPLGIEVGGADEGEQLTHIMAAMEVLKDVQENGSDPKEALRNYTKRVRESIS
ncbi:MAG: hypothetical protein IPN95_00085 [Bacteroidetes bacterium]|nr:hypothetical protein [Bacteroidota bacterium]MBL0017801.1 hypothetical protein [Bacteroidota bacterium]MBP6639476.1 hypothetical protein [Bacteroidia bacterium]